MKKADLEKELTNLAHTILEGSGLAPRYYPRIYLGRPHPEWLSKEEAGYDGIMSPPYAQYEKCPEIWVSYYPGRERTKRLNMVLCHECAHICIHYACKVDFDDEKEEERICDFLEEVFYKLYVKGK